MSDTWAQTAILDEAPPSTLILVLRKMWQLRLGVFGTLLITGLLFTAVFTPWLAPHDPYKQDIMNRLLPPAWMEGGQRDFLLGSDHLGRDLLSRIMHHL